MKYFGTFMLLCWLGLSLGCRGPLPDPTQLELTLRILDQDDQAIPDAYVFFSLDMTAEEMADEVAQNGLGFGKAQLRNSSIQGYLSIYPLTDFPGIEEKTTIHLYVRAWETGAAPADYLDNLAGVQSFYLKKLKAKAHAVTINLTQP